MSTELSIIIVNWNGGKLLPVCLRSIVENPPAVSFEIVVVDNASSDDSVQWMKSPSAREILQDTNFTLIESNVNLGFGNANNLAFEKTESPFLFVLNPDTLISDGAIDRLLETLRADRQTGVTAPRLLNENGDVTPSVMAFPETPFSIVVNGLKFYKLLPGRFLSDRLFGEHWSYDRRIPVPIVAGAAMMCKREMIDQIGGFDPAIHMYGEDLEWCVRINRGGWQIVFEPLADVYHIGGKSTEQRWDRTEISLIQEQAIVRFNNQCFSPALNILNGLTKTLVLAIHYLRWKIRGDQTSLLIRLMKLHTNNCRNLLREYFQKIKIKLKRDFVA